MASDQTQREVVIVNQMGLHARPATMFVTLSNTFQCEILVRKDDEQVDGKSILGVLSLAAEAGSTLLIEAKGMDAQQAVHALCELVESGFNETEGQNI